MHRPATRAPSSQICQICRSISARSFHTALAKPFSTPRGAAGQRLQVPRGLSVLSQPSRPASRPYTAARAPRQGRAAKAASPPGAEVSSPASEAPDVTRLVASARQARDALLSRDDIPTEAEVAAALRACQAAADVIMDTTIRPDLGGADSGAPSSGGRGGGASDLLLLDSTGGGAGGGKPSGAPPAAPALEPGRARDVIDAVSEAAYAIVAHPNVAITPELLEQYVAVQARLGAPETLPHVFDLYASKPLAQGGPGGGVRHAARNPDKVASAVDPEVAGRALDVAIQAKNLDAAVGIIESTFSTRASVRAKLVRRALVPAGALAAAPVGAYLIAANLSRLQDTMDERTATTIAFAGILAYVGFTATMGAVAVMTQNDQMRRVTWVPGTPLRQRWLREEERAALDKVACEFGFSEATRWGEEEGAEFQALREYILRKGMILDQLELMEGMS